MARRKITPPAEASSDVVEEPLTEVSVDATEASSDVVEEPMQPIEEVIAEPAMEAEEASPVFTEEPSQFAELESSPSIVADQEVESVVKPPIKKPATKPRQLPGRPEERRSRNKLKFIR